MNQSCARTVGTIPDIVYYRIIFPRIEIDALHIK